MADEAPVPTEETPDNVEAPAEVKEPDTPEIVNFQERYENLRPEFDRKSQRLSEVESILQDPERLAAHWEEQGFGPEDDDTLYQEPVDPSHQEIEQLRQETAELKEWRTQQETQAQTAAEHEFVADSLAGIENKLGQELPQKVANWIGNVALQNRDEQGRPDVESAFKEWQEVVDAERENWVKTKKVKSRPGTGAAAVEQVDKSTRKGRVDYLTQRMNELET